MGPFDVIDGKCMHETVAHFAEVLDLGFDLKHLLAFVLAVVHENALIPVSFAAMPTHVDKEEDFLFCHDVLVEDVSLLPEPSLY